MRAIMESLFDLAYLIGVFALGVLILKKSAGRKEFRLYGLMCLVLVCGDAFHLAPRIVGLNHPLGLDGFTAALGIGKLVTSITMTIFYVMLYHFWQLRTGAARVPARDGFIWGPAALRIALCCFPQNAWTSADAPVIWGIYRNLPFVLMGAVIAWLFFTTAKQDRRFRFAWLAIVLSFAFYIPVVLWADASPMIGMLMLPKTCCYVWLVLMGRKACLD